MHRIVSLWIVAGLLFSGCGESGPEHFSLRIVFPQGARELADSVTVFVLMPSQDASCAALLDESARPGTEGYALQLEETIDPASADPMSIRFDKPGRRLFLVEADDSDGELFLRGCQDAQAGGSGPKEVTVQLNWVGEACQDDSECRDELWCNGDESCLDGVCIPGSRDCDDQDPCTEDECNESEKRCENRPVQPPPDEEGPPGDASCDDDLDNDCDGLTDGDDTDCKQCNDNSECDDQDDCTTDSCQGGQCVNEQTSTACHCGLRPTDLELDCQSPVSLASSDSAACSITLSGGDNLGRADCLSCSAEVGVHVVELADFDDGSGNCDPDGWALVAGAPQNNCRARVDSCSFAGGPAACCDDFATICETQSFGNPVLVTSADSNCTGEEQWRLYKTFDLSDLSDPWLCFDLADRGAVPGSGLLLFAEDGNNPQEQIYCQDGEPQAGLDDFFNSQCLSLPAWAAGSPDLTLTFVMHSDASGEMVFLDNITLRAWSGGCAPDNPSLLDEDFAGCDYSAWSLSGQDPGCLDPGCAGPGLFAESGAFTLDTSLDATEADSELRVCMQLGSNSPTAGDSVTLSYDAGSGFQTAWQHTGSLGPDGDCLEVCLNLSDLDPAVNNHPALGVRLSLDGGGAYLYSVQVEAARNCAAGQALNLQLPPSEGGGGVYSFDTVNTGSALLSGSVSCEWDQAPSVSGKDRIEFQP